MPQGLLDEAALAKAGKCRKKNKKGQGRVWLARRLFDLQLSHLGRRLIDLFVGNDACIFCSPV